MNEAHAQGKQQKVSRQHKKKRQFSAQEESLREQELQRREQELARKELAWQKTFDTRERRLGRREEDVSRREEEVNGWKLQVKTWAKGREQKLGVLNRELIERQQKVEEQEGQLIIQFKQQEQRRGGRGQQPSEQEEQLSGWRQQLIQLKKQEQPSGKQEEQPIQLEQIILKQAITIGELEVEINYRHSMYPLSLNDMLWLAFKRRDAQAVICFLQRGATVSSNAVLRDVEFLHPTTKQFLRAGCCDMKITLIMIPSSPPSPEQKLSVALGMFQIIRFEEGRYIFGFSDRETREYTEEIVSNEEIIKMLKKERTEIEKSERIEIEEMERTEIDGMGRMEIPQNRTPNRVLSNQILSTKLNLLYRGVEIGGDSLLTWAAEYGHEEIVKFLLNQEVDINYKNGDGDTALHLAAMNGHLEMMGLLLKHGVKIEQTNHWGDSPLLGAAKNGQWEAVQLLLANGADPHALNSEGHSLVSFPEILGKLHKDVRQLTFDFFNILCNKMHAKMGEKYEAEKDLIRAQCGDDEQNFLDPSTYQELKLIVEKCVGLYGVSDQSTYKKLELSLQEELDESGNDLVSISETVTATLKAFTEKLERDYKKARRLTQKALFDQPKYIVSSEEEMSEENKGDAAVPSEQLTLDSFDIYCEEMFVKVREQYEAEKDLIRMRCSDEKRDLLDPFTYQELVLTVEKCTNLYGFSDNSTYEKLRVSLKEELAECENDVVSINAAVTAAAKAFTEKLERDYKKARRLTQKALFDQPQYITSSREERSENKEDAVVPGERVESSADAQYEYVFFEDEGEANERVEFSTDAQYEYVFFEDEREAKESKEDAVVPNKRVEPQPCFKEISEESASSQGATIGETVNVALKALADHLSQSYGKLFPSRPRSTTPLEKIPKDSERQGRTRSPQTTPGRFFSNSNSFLCKEEESLLSLPVVRAHSNSAARRSSRCEEQRPPTPVPFVRA